MNVERICKDAKAASYQIARADSETKNRILDLIKFEISRLSCDILEANAKDMELAKANGRDSAFLDRLFLDEARIRQMCDGIDALKKLPDPVGKVVSEYMLPNGLKVRKVRSPLGVVGIIFEARPNVALDAAALCIKSGNAVVLRGSRESTHSVRTIVSAIRAALVKAGIDENAVSLIDSMDREATIDMLRQDMYVDVMIPRGGETLKKVVLANANMAVLASAGGNCHVYVSKHADIEKAKAIVVNAKTSRPGVCNAQETLLMDRAIAKDHALEFCDMLKELGVEIRVSSEVASLCKYGKEIDESEYSLEYHDMKIKVVLVDGVDEAIAHINKYGTHHSDAIVSENKGEIDRFLLGVDSAAVYANASTRFTDGFELGLGAEMGISTQKLHVRGPIGLEELTSAKYVIEGSGQLRR